MFYDDAYVISYQKTVDGELKQDQWYVDKETYDKYEVGDEFVYDEEHCSSYCSWTRVGGSSYYYHSYSYYPYSYYMLDQASLASRNVLSQLRQATNHPVLLDFDETCLLNQVLDQPNATIVRHRLSRLAKHTSIPILVEAIRSLQSKLMYFEASSQVGKVYKDRLDHRIMTLPVYRI